MATFPSIAPIHSLDKSIAPARSRTKLGDGYLGTHKFSLNTNKPEWQLEWLVDLADASTIDTFLRAQASGNNFFEWTPPDSTTLGTWRCNEWTVEQVGPEVYRISAAFKRVFELTFSLVEVPGICAEEYCGFDYGNWEIIVPEIGSPPFSPYINSTISAPPISPCTGAALQWYRNGNPIAGATSSNYTLVGADNGQAITVGFDCPGDLPGGTGISTPIYPVPYPWEQWNGSTIQFAAPGVFSFAMDVYSDFGVYKCGTNDYRFGEYIAPYRTYTYSSADVTGFRLTSAAVLNQTGICLPQGAPGGYVAGTPRIEKNFSGNYEEYAAYIFWSGTAGVGWGPITSYSPEPRGIVSHVVVNATFNGQPIYAPIPS